MRAVRTTHTTTTTTTTVRIQFRFLQQQAASEVQCIRDSPSSQPQKAGVLEFEILRWPLAMPVVAGKAAVSGVSTGWSLSKAFAGAEPDSVILAKLLGHARNNGLCGAATGPASADSPLLGCLCRTFVGPTDQCAVGNCVFYTERNLGKSAALRTFCGKTLKQANRRSMCVSGLGSKGSYFENIADNLELDPGTNWAKCLVASMTCGRGESCPVLVLDEFNSLGGKNVNLDDMDMFMQHCLDKKLFLFIATSNEEVAKKLISLNHLVKIKPLQAVHKFNVFNNASCDEDPSWKTISWSAAQLKKVVIKHFRHDRFGEFDFLLPTMNPHQAMQAADLCNSEHNLQEVLPAVSDMS